MRTLSRPLLLVLLALASPIPRAEACCAIARTPVVNADQTVLILWDAEEQKQHFVRRASFKGKSQDLGFIVPSPSEPELEEAGDKVFDLLKKIAAPPPPRSAPSIGCSKAAESTLATDSVVVLQEKTVAGFDAVVLQAGSSDALLGWLKKHDYPYSDGLADWAAPYVANGWPFTALKVSSDAPPANDRLEAPALRISFATDTPIFPYREPASKDFAETLGVSGRLLRIYFISDEAYRASFDTGKVKWTGVRHFSGEITQHKGALLEALNLPAGTGPEKWWLTEFDDQWPYTQAPGDLVFEPSGDRKQRHRTAATYPIHDPVLYAFGIFTLGLLIKRFPLGTPSHR